MEVLLFLGEGKVTDLLLKFPIGLFKVHPIWRLEVEDIDNLYGDNR